VKLNGSLDSLNKLYVFARDLGLQVAFGSENSRTTRISRRYVRHEIQIELRPKDLFHMSGSDLQDSIGRNLAHELGHYIVAPKGRRHRKDYGIPGTSTKRWAIDEGKAILIENYLLKRFGFGCRMRLLKYPVRSNRHRSVREHHREIEKWWREDGERKIKSVLMNGLE